MQRSMPDDGLNKFQRYRATQRASGLKLLRLWVPDPHAEGFRQEAERQAAMLREAPEEREALNFIEAAMEFGDADQ